jgi:repressor LexA
MSMPRHARYRRTTISGYPSCGSIAAGEPSDQCDASGRRIHTVEELIPDIRPGDFFLTVSGDSMIDAGLEPGQYVVIRPEQPQRNGEICAVWVDGIGATLKYLYREGEMVRLLPANPRYSPSLYRADEVHVQGVLVASLAVLHFRR